MKALICAEPAGLAELRRYAASNNWEVIAEYPHGGRPDPRALIKDAHRQQVGVVLVGSFSCFARRAKELVLALAELHSRGIAFISLAEELDTTSPTGVAVIRTMVAAAALEETSSGFNNSSEPGSAQPSRRKVGRPKKVLNIEKIIELRSQNKSWREIGQACGGGATTVRKAYWDAVSKPN